MAFIGSYILVIAFENANLHKRFALKILMTVGPQPRWLLFGTMLSASCLSMVSSIQHCNFHFFFFSSTLLFTVYQQHNVMCPSFAHC